MAQTRRIVLTMLLALSSSGVLGCGEETGGNVTLVNQSPYWLHFFLPDEVFLFIQPHATATVNVGDDNHGRFLVGTGPGQDIDLRAEAEGYLCGCGRCGSVTATHDGTRLHVEVRGDSACGGSSCPFVYAHDGRGFVLQGEALTGAINRGAWRHDALVLPAVKAQAGEYRLRIGAVLPERDHLDRVALELVEHPPATRLALDLQGKPWALPALIPARRARDASGRDQLAALASEDGQRWGSWKARPARETLKLEFALPPSARSKGDPATLLVVGRNTAFIEETYHRFMARFGPGWPTVLRWMSRLPSYRRTMADLARSAGLGMTVEVYGKTGWREAAWLPPVGMSADRAMAVPIALPGGGGPLRVRLVVLPAAWELDAVLLAPKPLAVPQTARRQVKALKQVLVLQGRRAPASPDRLAETDGRFQVLAQGDHLTLSFAAPPTRSPDTQRTAVLRLAGYYEDLRQSSPLRFRLDRVARALVTDGSFETYAMEELARLDPRSARSAHYGAHPLEVSR